MGRAFRRMRVRGVPLVLATALTCLALSAQFAYAGHEGIDVAAPSRGQTDRPETGRGPVVSHVSPGHGGRNGGNAVTIRGRHLAGARTVTFGSKRATHLRVRSASKITVRPPKHAPGLVDVRVTTAAGRSKAREADRYLFTSLDWKSVVQGSEYTCGLRTDSTLWCWGYSSFGELGLGDYDDRYTPTLVDARRWRQVSAGSQHHTCAITSAGALYCWGENRKGELGLGDHSTRTRPARVGSQKWRQVDVGSTSTCAVRADRTLWCWGDNTDGQLGVGDEQERTTPTRVGAAAGWAHISVGGIHACGVRTDGSLWCWGDGFEGETGQGLLAADTSTPTRVGSGTSWVEVSAGQGNTCGRQQDASLWCWGLNSNGQLGVGDYDDRGTPVRVGNASWSFAEIDQGEPCAVNPAGGLWCWGGQGYDGVMFSAAGNSPIHVGTKRWTTVSSGYSSRCAIRTDASLWCWGYNYHGELGVGDDLNRTSFVHVVTR